MAAFTAEIILGLPVSPSATGNFPEQSARVWGRQVLLIPDVLVRRHQKLKPGLFGGLDQFAICEFFPPTRSRFLHGMANPQTREAARRTVVEKNEHRGGRTNRSLELCPANAPQTLRLSISSRVTGNCSITSSILIPASRFSNKTRTGVLVPFNTHAPLTFPGILSTTRHCDQSSVEIFRPHLNLIVTLLVMRSFLKRSQATRVQSCTIASYAPSPFPTPAEAGTARAFAQFRSP